MAVAAAVGDAEGTVHVEVVGDNPNPGFFRRQQRHTVLKILRRVRGAVLKDDAECVNPVGHKPVTHAFCLRDRLVSALSAGDNADHLRMFAKILLRGLQPVQKHPARAVVAHLRAEHNQVVNLFALRLKLRSDAQKKRYIHADAKGNQRNNHIPEPLRNMTPQPEVSRRREQN